MQDILASIRRILSEDERVPEAPVLTSVAAPGVFRLDESMLVHPPAAPPPAPPPAAAAPAPKAPEPPERDEDVVAAPVETDLVQMILGKVPAAGPMAPDTPPEPSPPEPVPQHLEPPDALAAVDSQDEAHARTPPDPTPPEPPPADPPPAEAEPAPLAAPMVQEQPTPPALDATMSDVTTTHPPDHVPAELKLPALGEPLVAPESAAATQSVVAGLMRQLSSERTTPVFREGPTIEDLVREEMRPLLKHWLDTHLPPMVERLVRSELDRLIARAAP
jgi:cell pole-organizing protein PopZ